MHKRMVFLWLSLALAWPARADVIGVVEGPPGRLNLFDEVGPCVAGARRAELTAPDGSTVAGCWVFREGVLQVALLDGQFGVINPAAVMKPTRS
jgi:hypothetical protein